MEREGKGRLRKEQGRVVTGKGGKGRERKGREGK